MAFEHFKLQNSTSIINNYKKMYFNVLITKSHSTIDRNSSKVIELISNTSFVIKSHLLTNGNKIKRSSYRV